MRDSQRREERNADGEACAMECSQLVPALNRAGQKGLHGHASWGSRCSKEAVQGSDEQEDACSTFSVVGCGESCFLRSSQEPQGRESSKEQEKPEQPAGGTAVMEGRQAEAEEGTNRRGMTRDRGKWASSP